VTEGLAPTRPQRFLTAPAPSIKSWPVSTPDMEQTARALNELGAATLGESGGVPMAPRLGPAWPGSRLVAPAFTVSCARGDNLAVHVAVTRCPRGSALVVDVSGLEERGYWGEVLTTAAEAAGIAGLVIDGGVRDIAALQAHGFPVFSTMIALAGATKVGGGSIGRPVRVGDVEVRTGDWVVGDSDGVTIVAAERMEEVLAAGKARAVKEAGMFGELRAGRTTLELLGVDPSPITT